MSTEVQPDNWELIDPWWRTYVTTQSVITTTERARGLDNQWWEGMWKQLDPWWDAYVETRSLAQADQKVTTLDRRMQEGTWTDLDQWWKTYSEVRREEVAELEEVLEELNQTWEQSNSRFDTDPLATDWTRHSNTRGPLRPNQEENWSQWLAHLLRSSAGELTSELFGEQFDKPADSVEREIHLPDFTSSDRYADILVFYDGRGISIEVKKNDEHYGKTTHTAGLIEREFRYDWHHVLLLPRHKESALRQTFRDGFEIDEKGNPHLRSNESGPISVLYWEDISSAIRNVLRSDVAIDPHWEASAYLFCTLIEQKLLRFNPYPVIDRMASSDGVIHTSQSLSVATGDVEEQIRYLRETIERDHE